MADGINFPETQEVVDYSQAAIDYGTTNLATWKSNIDYQYNRYKMYYEALYDKWIDSMKRYLKEVDKKHKDKTNEDVQKYLDYVQDTYIKIAARAFQKGKYAAYNGGSLNGFTQSSGNAQKFDSTITGKESDFFEKVTDNMAIGVYKPPSTKSDGTINYHLPKNSDLLEIYLQNMFTKGLIAARESEGKKLLNELNSTATGKWTKYTKDAMGRNIYSAQRADAIFIDIVAEKPTQGRWNGGFEGVKTFSPQENMRGATINGFEINFHGDLTRYESQSQNDQNRELEDALKNNPGVYGISAKYNSATFGRSSEIYREINKRLENGHRYFIKNQDGSETPGTTNGYWTSDWAQGLMLSSIADNLYAILDKVTVLLWNQSFESYPETRSSSGGFLDAPNGIHAAYQMLEYYRFYFLMGIDMSHNSHSDDYNAWRCIANTLRWSGLQGFNVTADSDLRNGAVNSYFSDSSGRYKLNILGLPYQAISMYGDLTQMTREKAEKINFPMGTYDFYKLHEEAIIDWL